MSTGFQKFEEMARPKTRYNCTQYANSSYISANAPVSQVVMPQGEVKMPNSIEKAPLISSVPTPPEYNPSVNYNQVTPYLNTGSPVFQPCVTTKSGQYIPFPPPECAKPVNTQEAEIVYRGPLSSVNPQVTPTEQTDNEINKQMNQYFKNSAEYNNELRKTMHKTSDYDDGSTPWYKTLFKYVFWAAVIAGSIYSYRNRHKWPKVEKFFQKTYIEKFVNYLFH